MTIDEARAISDGYKCILWCDQIVGALAPDVSDTDEILQQLDPYRRGPASQLAHVIERLGSCPKSIRDRVELLVQECAALVIQDMTEIREAAAAQLEAR